MEFTRVFSILSILLFVGCVPVTNFESGRTLGLKKSRRYIKYTKPTSINIESYRVDDVPLSHLELGYQYGVSENFDLSVSTNLTKLQVNGKLQLTSKKTSKYANSIGLGGAVIGDSDPLGTTGRIITIPQFNSFHFDEHFFIYLNPQYKYYYLSGFLYSTHGLFNQFHTEVNNLHFYGATAGLSFKNNRHELILGLSLDYIYKYKIQNKFIGSIQNYGLKYSYHLRNRKKSKKLLLVE